MTFLRVPTTLNRWRAIRNSVEIESSGSINRKKTVNRVKSPTTLFDRSSIDATNERLHVPSLLECDERGPTVGDKRGFDKRPLDFRGENRVTFEQGTPVTRYRGGDGFH